MRHITDSYIKEHLKSAVTGIVPQKAEEIWNQPVEKAAGDEWYLDGILTEKRKKSGGWKILSSVAACLVICLMSYYMVSIHTDATIYMDVNPSVELQVNYREKVVTAQAGNQDGKVVLEDMDLKNTDLDVAVNAILGSMVKHGYLNEAQNMILLSVDSRNQKKSEKIRKELTEEIDSCLNSLLGSGVVFSQDVQVNEKQKERGEKYGISPGKAALLERILEDHPSLKYETLAKLSMSKLFSYLDAQGIDMKAYAEYTGEKIEEWENKQEKDSDASVEKEVEEQDEIEKEDEVQENDHENDEFKEQEDIETEEEEEAEDFELQQQEIEQEEPDTEPEEETQESEQWEREEEEFLYICSGQPYYSGCPEFFNLQINCVMVPMGQ